MTFSLLNFNMLFQLVLTKLNCFGVNQTLITLSSQAKSLLVELKAFDLEPQNVHVLRRRHMELRLVLFTSDASLTFVDIFPLAETITNLQVVVVFCVFSPDLSFENGSVIFLIDDQRKTARTLQWLLDFDWLPISHECLVLSANCITMPDKVIIKNAMSQTSICQ